MEVKKNIETNIKSIWRHPIELSLCILLIGIVLVTFAQVLFRYVFHFSLAWTEELARYLLLWMASLSIGYAFKTKSHFALRFVVDRFDTGIKKIIATLVSFLMVGFLIVFTWKAIEYTWSVADQTGPGTGLSMSVPYSSAIFAGMLMLYYIIKNWWEDTFRPTSTNLEIGNRRWD